MTDEFNAKDYILPDAKVEVKRRADAQLGNVQKKLQKWADRVVVGGFNPKKEKKRKEGEIWEDDNGKTWTVKNGIKQTIRKNQIAVNPFWCPRCGMSLHHKLHAKFYRIRGACHDCVVSYEGKMRFDGVWEAYERRQLRRNEVAFLRDKISEADDFMRTFKVPQIHFENGGWEELASLASFEGKFAELRKDIQFMNDRISQIQKEEAEDADNYRKLEEWEREYPWEFWKAPEPVLRKS